MNFLESVAVDLLKRSKGDLSNYTVVFPNKRSRIFFTKYIAAAAKKSIWLPKYDDMNSIFMSLSKLKSADTLMLCSLLYKVYSKHIHRTEEAGVEQFDDFFFFGEILLNDFNDIDSYMVDANAIYRNLNDLHKLEDDFSHLNEEQWKILNRFFIDIKSPTTKLRDNFASIWSVLGDVYNDFREELKRRQIGYRGMIHRDAVENIADNTKYFEQQKFVFVGFNVLTKCEEKLLDTLKPKSLFYWDYDRYYLEKKEHEAGKFIRKNMQRFPPPQDFEPEDRNFEKPKNINIICSSSNTLQASYAKKWIDKIEPNDITEPNSAVVLCQESLLLPLLEFVPEEAKEINITMGFPINQTPIHDLILRIIELYQKGCEKNGFYHSYLTSVLKHQYCSIVVPDSQRIIDDILDENLFVVSYKKLGEATVLKRIDNSLQMIELLLNIVQQIGAKQKEQHENISEKNLYSEAIFKVFTVLNRLFNLVSKDELNVSVPTLCSLLKRLLSVETVAFSGEPAKGLQIMGLLETRNLDFKNLLITSLNEGIMPKTDNNASFIPHFIRKILEINDVNSQDAMFAYYFYRLLQRAENITLIYNTTPNQTSKAELSRFALQLITEYPFAKNIKYFSLESQIEQTANTPISIEKTAEITEKLHHDYFKKNSKKYLSPSAINTYIKCNLQFYFKYVAALKEPDVFEDELDSRILGNIIHKTIDLIYREIGNIAADTEFATIEVEKRDIERYLVNKILIDNLLEKAFDEDFFKQKVAKSEYNGEQIIYFNIAKTLISNVLRYDSKNTPFEILGLERKKTVDIELSYDQSVVVGGTIDRIRKKGSRVFVEDFKTGASKKELKISEIDDLFDSNKRTKIEIDYIFQTFLYASLFKGGDFENNSITPTLLFLSKLGDNISEPETVGIELNKLEVKDFAPYREEFLEKLRHKISELLNPNIPFKATDNTQVCNYCNYRLFCRK